MLARVLLHTAERRADGLRLLERLLVAVETAGRIQRVIGILALQAVGLAAHGDETAALNALVRALTLAAPEGYVRTFVDEGAPMAALLHQGLGDRSWGLGDGSDGQAVRAYARRLLEAFPAAGGDRTETIPASPPSNPLPPTPAPLIEPLTPRERDVLRLLAEGLSGPEIAKSLIVSLSTVQTHLKSLYGKLDAHSRWEAVARARELHLL